VTSDITTTHPDTSMADPARRLAGATLYNNDYIAYLTLRPRTPASDEIGLVGQGPTSPALVRDTSGTHPGHRRKALLGGEILVC
jgi:hypothetical protein